MQDDDDLRIYVLASPSDIWFLTHDAPPLPQMQTQQAPKQAGLWQKLLKWFR
ncbi:hypothetical protein BegalDRAFT_3071 [Beggiatoa alba B18LD]|uniref:Uncharacterized protein n=2 Tax=Beggiatoa alba TaxID=1022 RepID=I3CJV4_9GAMM|nr:hypothetical protein BegalDRAFT_3071 [Beggiatoa alba B18LD]